MLRQKVCTFKKRVFIIYIYIYKKKKKTTLTYILGETSTSNGFYQLLSEKLASRWTAFTGLTNYFMQLLKHNNDLINMYATTS